MNPIVTINHMIPAFFLFVCLFLLCCCCCSQISPRQLRSNLRELCCILRVQWTKPKEAPVEFCHRINLLGAKPPRNFILLTIERPSQPSLGTSTLNVWYPNWWETEVTVYTVVLASLPADIALYLRSGGVRHCGLCRLSFFVKLWSPPILKRKDV